MTTTLNKQEYRENWEQKLDGTAFGLLETFVSEREAHDIVIDFIIAIRNARTKIRAQRNGVQLDFVKCAFSTALTVMDELGY